MDKGEAFEKMYKILDATSEVFCLTPTVILGTCRRRDTVEARSVFTHIAVEKNIPKPWVSEFLKKERTAYIYYMKLYDDIRNELIPFAARIESKLSKS